MTHPFRLLSTVLRHLARLAVASLIVTLLAAMPAPAASAQNGRGQDRDHAAAYRQAIDNTEAMVWNEHVIAMAAEHGLDVVNVAWEDTGRYDNSSVGPNISDVTIQVARPIDGSDEHTLALMPVIRHPNFTDLSGDIAIGEFAVPVGNERGDDLTLVTLEEYLGNIGRYLSDGGGLTPDLSLLAPRDSHVLVSAQAAFLPVPQEGIAEFNPVIFNYQSYEANPAVLTIVVTAQGTSATIIDNQRDGFGSGGLWGQRLFFNQNGERASLTGQRASEVRESQIDGDAEGLFADPRPEDRDIESGPDARGSNAVMIIQVPLEHEGFAFEELSDADACFTCSAVEDFAAAPESDVEDAVIGHGDVEGPFTELDGLMIERDPDFPVRVTVQFYKATASGEPSAADIDAIAADIARVYEDADFVGSLVTDGASGRPTEYQGEHSQPHDWWDAFLARHRHLFPWFD